MLNNYFGFLNICIFDLNIYINGCVYNINGLKH